MTSQAEAAGENVKNALFGPMQPIKRAALALHEGDLDAAEAHLQEALQEIQAA